MGRLRLFIAICGDRRGAQMRSTKKFAESAMALKSRETAIDQKREGVG